MLNSISIMVKAIAEMLQRLFKTLEINKKYQLESVLLSDKNNLQEASDLTEKIFWLVREYLAIDSHFTMWVAKLFYDNLNKKEKRLFKKFYKQKIKLKKKIEKKQKEFEKVN